MEIKVNREIRNYNEAIFLGLSMRQLIFSALAICVAIGVYFLLRDVMPLETRSGVCILCAAPFGALGFVSYNGMTAEKLLIAVIKYLITPIENHHPAQPGRKGEVPGSAPGTGHNSGQSGLF